MSELAEVTPSEPMGIPESMGESSEPNTTLPVDDILAAQGLDDMPTEAELKGELPDVKEEQAPSEPEKEEAEAPKEEVKMVKLEALHEARSDNKAIRAERDAANQQIALLNQQMLMLQTQQPPEQQVVKQDEFKVLSHDELADLIQDDPVEAAIYLDKKAEYLNQQTVSKYEEAQRNNTLQTQEANDNAMIETARTQIDELMPGIYTDDDVYEKLETFAREELGFSDQDFALSDPETLIYPVGATEPTVAGPQAVSVMRSVVAAYKSKQGEQAMRDEIRKELQVEFAEKLKRGESLETVALSTDIPTSTGKTPAGGDMSVARAQATMSPVEFEKFMQG